MERTGCCQSQGRQLPVVVQLSELRQLCEVGQPPETSRPLDVPQHRDGDGVIGGMQTGLLGLPRLVVPMPEAELRLSGSLPSRHWTVHPPCAPPAPPRPPLSNPKRQTGTVRQVRWCRG